MTSPGLRSPLLDVRRPHVSADENSRNEPMTEESHYPLNRSKINVMKVIMCAKTAWAKCYTSAVMLAVS